MTGICGKRLRTTSRSSIPDMRGMLRSEIINSRGPARSFPIASRPSSATRTIYPAATKYPEMSFRTRGSSSTNKTRQLSCPTLVAPSASWDGSLRTAPPDRDSQFTITHMVKKCLRGEMSMLVLYAHGTDYSNSVAIVRLADVSPWRGGGSTDEGERKGTDCHFLGMQVGHPRQPDLAEYHRGGSGRGGARFAQPFPQGGVKRNGCCLQGPFGDYGCLSKPEAPGRIVASLDRKCSGPNS